MPWLDGQRASGRLDLGPLGIVRWKGGCHWPPFAFSGAGVSEKLVGGPEPRPPQAKHPDCSHGLVPPCDRSRWHAEGPGGLVCRSALYIPRAWVLGRLPFGVYPSFSLSSVLRSGFPISCKSYRTRTAGLVNLATRRRSMGVATTMRSQSTALMVASSSLICLAP